MKADPHDGERDDHAEHARVDLGGLHEGAQGVHSALGDITGPPARCADGFSHF